MLKIVFLIIVTNLITLYIFTTPHSNLDHPLSRISQLPFFDIKPLLLKLNATQDQLQQSHSRIENLQTQLNSAHHLLESLIDHLNDNRPGVASYAGLLDDLPDEARLAAGPHMLPLGNTPRIGSEIYASVGGGCLNHKQDLAKYMSYDVGWVCPSDDVFAQILMLKGCEPLPRRKCHPPQPKNYAEPRPLPGSMWATPHDTSIVWDPEKSRWQYDNGGLDFGMEQVLATKAPGSVRIGLDIGGGSGTFAARMRERNVTIVTTSMNFDGPFNSFIASRGLIPMHVSISQRFPFFENTLDIVHSMHVLSNWIPDPMLEFVLYDIYRVLRPGGLFWLDRFFCFGSQLNETYVPMFDRVGFRRLRWNTGMKLDRGIQKNEWYFSALLEKPILT
ncbi:hypothetical protein SASPL_131664 [Salvia splendens]|uniref:Methyltransferase type 11 domain-containing protein n=1 Tax=Salvia splendens TaxID=180675 RepID=A0A8X8XBG4_SALSN|nr:hypothetical protein SASPL_131664 [Salvia splendens]